MSCPHHQAKTDDSAQFNMSDSFSSGEASSPVTMVTELPLFTPGREGGGDKPIDKRSLKGSLRFCSQAQVGYNIRTLKSRCQQDLSHSQRPLDANRLVIKILQAIIWTVVTAKAPVRDQGWGGRSLIVRDALRLQGGRIKT